MKILLADKFPADYLAILEKMHSCTYQPDLTADELADAMTDHDVLVVRGTKVEKPTIDKASNLKLIIRAGSGTNTIDKAHAASQNIAVCNTPARNAIAVAELAMGLLLAADRHIASADADAKKEEWNKGTYSKATGLYGRKIGIVGFGAIGQEFAKRAVAFGMELHVYNRPNKALLDAAKEKFELTLHPNIESLAEAVDIISFHVPLTDDTKGFVDVGVLSHFKDNSILINTSRGELINETALLAVLDSKNITAGLDVFQDEPKSNKTLFDSAIFKHPNVIATPHIGASTTQAQLSVAEAVCDIISQFEQGNIINQVN